eukprot:2831829-Pleurochrysis_carterae.AAC.2
MGRWKSTARGGQQPGSGRLDAHALSQRQRVEAGTSNPHAESQAQSANTTNASSQTTRTRTSAVGTSADNNANAQLSPVSQARAARHKPVSEMSCEELHSAYGRAVQQRNYAWRRIRALTSSSSAASISTPAAARTTTKRPATPAKGACRIDANALQQTCATSCLSYRHPTTLTLSTRLL